jgi:hypothetical protein
VPKVIVEIRVYELPVLLALLDEFERLMGVRRGLKHEDCTGREPSLVDL